MHVELHRLAHGGRHSVLGDAHVGPHLTSGDLQDMCYVYPSLFHCSFLILKYFVQTRQNKNVLTDLMELYLRAGNLLG